MHILVRVHTRAHYYNKGTQRKKTTSKPPSSVLQSLRLDPSLTWQDWASRGRPHWTYHQGQHTLEDVIKDRDTSADNQLKHLMPHTWDLWFWALQSSEVPKETGPNWLHGYRLNLIHNIKHIDLKWPKYIRGPLGDCRIGGWFHLP